MFTRCHPEEMVRYRCLYSFRRAVAVTRHASPRSSETGMWLSDGEGMTSRSRDMPDIGDSLFRVIVLLRARLPERLGCLVLLFEPFGLGFGSNVNFYFSLSATAEPAAVVGAERTPVRSPPSCLCNSCLIKIQWVSNFRHDEMIPVNSIEPSHIEQIGFKQRSLCHSFISAGRSS